MNADSAFNKVRNFLAGYFTLSGYLVPQEEAEKSIREGVSFRGTTMFILICAIFVASLGLNTNSTAVIIGAMLISPLMGPIIGVGLGVGIHDFSLIKQSVRNLAMAATFSVIASTVYFLISPVEEGHSELLARTSPTIYDVLIAFFGGMAGIIGIGSSNKGNVIPGVAIATALMPPLCTAGYGLATWQLHYFFGAFYLFLINSIFIAFATTVGVKIMKYRNHAFADPRRAQQVRRIVYFIVILTMLPSVYLTYTMLRHSQYMNNVRTFVTRTMHFPNTQVLSYNVVTDKGQRRLDVTLIGRILPADSLKLVMTARMADYGLAGTELNFIQGDDRLSAVNTGTMTSAMLKDFYQVSQATIDRQQHTIDSLLTAAARDTVSATIAPELKVLFPQVSDMAVNRSIFSSVDSAAALDTVTVALVRYSAPMNRAAEQKLQEYLEARLRVPSIQIVDITRSVKLSEP